MNKDKVEAKTTRLSQKERSQRSKNKLIQASIDSLIELGYANTSIQEICKRAELSKGGLFRQYATRSELMIATGGYIYQLLITQYKDRFKPWLVR